MVGVMLGEKDLKQLNLISLSDNTIERRINETAQNVSLTDRFNDFVWLAKLAYVADIFSHFNGLSLGLGSINLREEALASLGAKELLAHFWLHVTSEYPDLSDKAVRFLITFLPTDLCETGFSVLVALKTKYRSKLNVEPDLRWQLSSLQPNIQHLVSVKQHKPSH
ncbi:ZBED5 protein, partial [Atractosteus spatula]|nr:ZBED5 protein [Atractosteus spatula]